MECNKLDISFNEALIRIGKGNLLNKVILPNDAKPFIKWVGGKRSLMSTLLANAPKQFTTYYEPFVGGGALFFALKPQKAVLLDLNIDLAITYNVVKKKPMLLIDALAIHNELHNEEYYYSIRKMQTSDDEIVVASRFIYLNKTCYNGLYRVNSKGEFNVPMGNYKSPLILDKENILECSKVLQNATIEFATFQKSLLMPQRNDFVYLDPPYHPINSDSFTKYNKDGFTEGDQIELYKSCKQLHERGVKFMLSNSDTPFINNLYKDKEFNIQIVTAPRMVNCKSAGRSSTNEVLIRNYE